jgi:hypothetical protein
MSHISGSLSRKFPEGKFAENVGPTATGFRVCWGVGLEPKACLSYAWNRGQLVKLWIYEFYVIS